MGHGEVVGPVYGFDLRRVRGDEGEEVDDLGAVGVDYGYCLVFEEGHGDAGAGGDEVGFVGGVGVWHCEGCE